MPRGIGASSGVNDSVTCWPDASARDCSISGVCWCTPPTLYADIEPITCEASSASDGLRPAPDVPDAATTTTSCASARPAASTGARASATAVA